MLSSSEPLWIYRRKKSKKQSLSFYSHPENNIKSASINIRLSFKGNADLIKKKRVTQLTFTPTATSLQETGIICIMIKARQQRLK